MTIVFEDREYELRAGETVLECLERAGHEIPSFCRSGNCQTCLMRATAGNVPAAAQAGLKPAWRQRGLFLACVCKPTGDLSLSRTDVAKPHHTRVQSVDFLSPRVLRVFLERPSGFEYEAGQFVQLVRTADGLMRPYSLASLPGGERLELHVARLPGGAMSGWLADAAGAEVEIRGPFGECTYLPGAPERRLVLAGTGTGLAPLLGVVRAALAAQHRAPIELVWGGRSPDAFYLMDELLALALQHPTLRITLSLAGADGMDFAVAPPLMVDRRPLEELLLENKSALAEQTTYLCGNADLVRALKKQLFLAGASLQDILADPFVHRAEV